LPATTVVEYILPLMTWAYLYSNFVVDFEKHRNIVRIGRSRSSNVDVFATNRKRVCDFLLVIYGSLGPILHRF